jgi:transcription antitermination factor NusG
VRVRCELTDEANHPMKDTPRVLDFLGADDEPTPILDAAAMHILAEMERSKASGVILELNDLRSSAAAANPAARVARRSVSLNPVTPQPARLS